MPPSLGDVGDFITGIATAVLALGAVLTALYGAFQYRTQGRERRGRWLMDLQARFFSEPSFRDVRSQLYNGASSELIQALRRRSELGKIGSPLDLLPRETELLVSLDNYLDFFVLIQHLLKNGELDLEEADNLFSWYVGDALDVFREVLEPKTFNVEIRDGFPAVVKLECYFDKRHEAERMAGRLVAWRGKRLLKYLDELCLAATQGAESAAGPDGD